MAKSPKFKDHFGREWPTQLGDLVVGSTFRIYGTEMCTVLSIEKDGGLAGVTYRWGKKPPHRGLLPLKAGQAYCSESSS